MRVSKMLLIAGFASILIGFGFSQANAQSNGRVYTEGNAGGDGSGSEITACNADAAKYCDDEIMWQHEMEECLIKHMNQISKACKAQLQPFSFKKYYNTEPRLF